jgi:hypothetical protein
VGVLAVVGKQLGMTTHDYLGYSNRPDGVSLTRELDKALVRIKPFEIQPGDVLSFWCETPGMIQHVALVTDRGLLHANLMFRKVIEHSMDSDWTRKIGYAYMFPNVELTPYPKPFKWVK